MSVFTGPLSRRVLITALIALTGLYLLWFGALPTPWAALLVFALPPAALAMAALRGWRQAGFWAGVLALGWFSHGVMAAWTRAPERLFACTEILLALVVIFAASIPGMKARFAKPKA
ncbi:DUF2069 domain-containing protein [Lysobacter solisilvae (ex Woo and Kim 2020)]|uniref:DUF2069 domain-containing protein n=1 Tax=Agrilutibacter terrestris TaxID=2865112 RepID=A0A7H0FV15_9GAMM|nr:DUF2069 domain-containing protein [Lysobacter terrestris]QNP39881.1 DUF2069 domain-containing protein [Lysobacter terrestris]